jgi:hypothetical protein
MEKRRRARINHCLNELKALILDAMKKDVSHISATFFMPVTVYQARSAEDTPYTTDTCVMYLLTVHRF